MKWFGRKAGVQPRPFLTCGWSGAVAGDPWPRSYEARVREAYLSNPVAQRAVKLVAEGVAGAAVYAAGKAEPAPGLATPPLLETVAAQLLLHGNAFVQILLDAQAMPAELFPLRPERVTIEAGTSGWPAAYVYKAGEAKTRWPARDALGRPSLAHIKALHPLDDHYGLGCLGAAAGAVAIHNEATRWNKSLLANAARPSGALVHSSADGSALSPEQYDRLRSEMEAILQGAANAGRPMLLDGGLKWQAMSLTPADMDFVGLKAAAARDIALAFGVPPMLLGLPGDATYANYREANRALWRLTILPLADKILAGLSAALGHWWPGVRLKVDIDQVSALAEDRERLWRQVIGADFLTRDEKRDMLGFDRQGRKGDEE